MSQKLSRLSGLHNGETASKSPSQSEIAIVIAISHRSPTHRAFSVNVASLVGHLATPATKTNDPGNGIKSARARCDLTTPSATNFISIHESPDPLDTISPAPLVAPKQPTVTPAIADIVKPLGSPVPLKTHRIDNRVEEKVGKRIRSDYDCGHVGSQGHD